MWKFSASTGGTVVVKWPELKKKTRDAGQRHGHLT
jgi:hypothetical protein